MPLPDLLLSFLVIGPSYFSLLFYNIEQFSYQPDNLFYVLNSPPMGVYLFYQHNDCTIFY